MLTLTCCAALLFLVRTFRIHSVMKESILEDLEVQLLSAGKALIHTKLNFTEQNIYCSNEVLFFGSCLHAKFLVHLTITVLL